MEVGDMELKADEIAEATKTPRRTVLNWMTKEGGLESYTPFGIRRYGRRTTVRKAIEFLARANDNGYRVKLLKDWLKERGMLSEVDEMRLEEARITRTDVLDSELN